MKKIPMMFAILTLVVLAGAFVFSVNYRSNQPAASGDAQLSVSGSRGGSSGGGIHYGCKDPNATNYDYFSASDPSLCVYGGRPLQNTSKYLEEATTLSQRANSTSIFSTKSSREKAQADLRALALKRQQEIISLAKTEVGIALATIVSNQNSGLLALLPKDLVEQPISQNVDLYVIHVDDFETHKDSHIYYVIKDGKKYDFYPAQHVESQLSGKADISGYVLGGVIIGTADNLVSYQQKPIASGKGGGANTTQGGPTIERTAVFLITDKKIPTVDAVNSQPIFTTDEAKDIIFHGEFEEYMEEQSYGQTKFDGDVFGWISEPNTYIPSCGSEGVGHGLGIDTYIKNNSVDLSKYDRILIVDPYYIGGCSGIGKWNLYLDSNVVGFASTSWVGGFEWSKPSVWTSLIISLPFSWTNFDYVLAHEFGHALGLPHANGWDCNSSIANSSDCNHVEYGNNFDVMGNGSAYSLQYNGFYKELLGWLKSGSVDTISKSGTYSLVPLESTKGVRLAKIKIQAKNVLTPSYPYYLEYRQGTGFDIGLNNSDIKDNQTGLFVLRENKNDFLPMDRILDMQPTSSPSWYDDQNRVTLNGGGSFFDPRTGVTIGPIISFNSQKIDFQITIGKTPNCVSQPPRVTNLWPYPSTVKAGDSFSLTFGFYNDDYITCGKSNFELTFNSPIINYVSNWAFSYYPEEGYPNFNNFIQVDPLTLPGSYNVTLTATNVTTGLSTSNDVTVTVI